MNPKTVLPIVFIAFGLIGIGYLLYSSGDKPAGGNLDSFAQCLAEKQVTMYGTVSCPHCQAEKKRFGSSFEYVPYVECTADPKACTDAGVEGVPTWIFPDGRRLVGEQGLEKLSQASGCPLPEAN